MLADDRCLILAAGFGTRMGPIGKRLPKVMWPVFGMSLLELQVHFARGLGYRHIYINLHHQAREILTRASRSPIFQDVTWLHETPEILDIGGGIHNLARRPEVNYQGELLVLNADQFLWFTAAELAKWRQQAGAFDGLLLTWQVNTDQGYNQVGTDSSGRFSGVVPNAQLPRGQQIHTYSGNSLINLASLKPRTGASAFFESVCPPSQRVMIAQLRAGRYWDFGTAARYLASLQGLLKLQLAGEHDEFLDFLIRVGALLPDKIMSHTASYNCQVRDVIHLGSGAVPADHAPGVVLEGSAMAQGSRPSLVFQGEVQELS